MSSLLFMVIVCKKKCKFWGKTQKTMSLIGNCLIRGVLNKQLYPILRAQSSINQIKVSLFPNLMNVNTNT